MRYLIDGHNLLPFHPRLKNLIHEKPDYVRDMLIIDLLNFRKNKRNASVFLFLDNNKAKRNLSFEKNGIKVKYSPVKLKADDIIVKEVNKLKAENIPVAVVTNDYNLKRRCAGRNVEFISSEEFMAEILNHGRVKGDEKPDRPLSDKEVDYWLNVFNED
jgi:predicted RNA-binding protein with PIN domain